MRSRGGGRGDRVGTRDRNLVDCGTQTWVAVKVVVDIERLSDCLLKRAGFAEEGCGQLSGPSGNTKLCSQRGVIKVSQ